MLNFYPIHNQQANLETWASRMHKNSLRIAPVSAIPAISSIQKHPRNSSNTSSNISTGAHLKWSQPVLKSQQPETLPDKSLDTEVLVSEFSQRYADPTKDLAFVTREARLQDTKNRQNSIQTDDERLQREWELRQNNVITEARMAYQWAIDNGIAKEQARAVLPEGLTESRLYMNGTLRSWVHFIELRSGHGTQLEHQEIAKACAKVIAEIFPMTTDLVAS